MANGVSSLPAIETAIQLGTRDPMEGCEEIFHFIGDRGARRGGHAIQFAAVARGKNDGFIENSAAAQFAGSVQRLLSCERDALAELDRSRAMVATNQRDAYAARSASGGRAFRVGRGSHQKKR